MIKRFTGKEQLLKLLLGLVAIFGGYLLVAWASYSPLDNSWTTATTFTTQLNHTGALGAWLTDLQLALLGHAAVIVPLALALVPLYLILFKRISRILVWKIAAWIGSFLLFLLGITGLLATLLADTPYYGAGGVVGSLISQGIEAHLGDAGVLLFSLVTGSVGFYFCSGQVLLRLAQRGYEWIVSGRLPKMPEPELQQAVENEEIFANREDFDDQTPFETETADESQPEANNGLTDVSAFIRPKIIGLQTTTAEDKEEIAAMAQVEAHSELPKISLQANTQPLQKNSENRPLADTLMATTPANVLPKVSLNQVEEASLPTRVELAPMLQEIEPIQPAIDPRKTQGIFPEIQLHQEMIDQAEWEAQKAQEAEKALEAKKAQAQPANVVVHPLLQRNTKTEKPTTPLPTLDLLDKHSAGQQKITEQEIRETSARIEKELANFGVKATVEDVLVGPVVTRYEILPASGVKAAKITNLDTDLARALIFKAIRITDVVPGKPYMGIETPNSHRETVWLRDVLDSQEFRQSSAILPMALGKDISGNPVVVDMAKMPHLLVAGQTGGGKSVGVNTMILSLLFKLTPEQVRFIMIDPKVVELSIYNDIPHLLTPVVTDMKKAENALRWAVEEMERRYQLVSYVQVRNIEGYNSKIEQAEAMGVPFKNPYWKPSDSMDLSAPPLEKMSYIVLIVDEFADLMMSAGKQVEEHIMRIAQKARAVGIHLILATQRPSTDVITGVIKANIPSRIAFTVSSQIDSRTILDKGGAESLLGRGDMLYSGASSPEIIRIHGAFMSDEEVQRVADDWRARGKPDYIESIVASREESGENNSESSGEIDPLFDEIAAYVVEANVTSISGIQRRFSIGFNRAARIIDQLTEQGILSEPDSRGKREVLAR